MMTEPWVLDIIETEFRRRRLPIDQEQRRALRAAAARIVSEAQDDQRAAARTASWVGALLTRGRTRL